MLSRENKIPIPDLDVVVGAAFITPAWPLMSVWMGPEHGRAEIGISPSLQKMDRYPLTK